MKSTVVRLFACSIFAATAVLLVKPSDAEARGRRRRCCPPVCVVACTAKPDYAELVCPMYRWMTYASYCSYYALGHDSCHPQSYDSTDCSLAASGCGAGSSGCVPSKRDTRSLHSNDLGNNGYGGNKVDKVTDTQLPTLSDLTNLKVDFVKKGIVRFRAADNSPIYAQFFIATVVPRSVPANHPELTPITAVRGMEINPATLGPGDYDLMGTLSSDVTITPVAGAAHEYLLTIQDPMLGQVSITIVTHRLTKGHTF